MTATKRFDTKTIYVKRKFNVRQNTNPSPEMVESISLQGITNPIHVAKLSKDDEKFFVVDGARRFRAARNLKLSRVPVFDEGVISLQEALVKSLTLNENRESLTEGETYAGFEKLRDTGMGLEEAAALVGVIASRARELEVIYSKASEPVKRAVKKGKKKGGVTTRTGSKVAQLPKDAQRSVIRTVAGKPTEEANKVVRKKRRKLGIKKGGVTRKTSLEPKSEPNGRIVFRDDYPIAEDIKDRCQIIEHEAKACKEWYPKNPIFQAYIDVIGVIKGGTSAMSLFKTE